MKYGPREKLKKYGVEILTDEELLALILRTGYKRKNVISLAKTILEKHEIDSFKELKYDELRKIKGLGDTKSASIIAAIEFAKRVLQRPLYRIYEPKDIIPYVEELKDKKKENFIALYLDTKNAVIKKEYISIGTLDMSILHPRELFFPAIECRAHSLIVVHNHPSGDRTPSEDDKLMTSRIIEAGKIVGIEVIDHIIVTKSDYFSFKEAGLI